MSFINSIQTIIRKLSGNILNFYISDGVLFYREFIANKGWVEPKVLVSDIKTNQFDIKIDKDNKVYGIVQSKAGKVLYIYSNNDAIMHKKLFEYDSQKYFLLHPYIQKIDTTIHIIYFLQDISNKQSLAIINHYYDGQQWIQKNLDYIMAYPVINPFIVSNESNSLRIFYFNKIDSNEEIFTMKFDPFNKEWSQSIQITNTKSNKLHLDVLSDNGDFHNITWNEFIDSNLVVRYLKCSFINDTITTSDVQSLSKPSNCSNPTLVITGKTLWNIWVQMNKLVSCYSHDKGENWSEPCVNFESTEIDFIRYKFSTNHESDLSNFKLHKTFGTYYPQISFIGFKNIQHE